MTRRNARAALALLWTLRLGILGMLAVGLSVLYHRHRTTPEQEELRRYIAVDAPLLRRAAAPIEERLAGVLADKRLAPEAVRKILVDEAIPGLLRVRELAGAPLAAARTAPVQALAREHLAVVDQLIDACRTAVRTIDDPRAGGPIAWGRVQQTFAEAARAQERWQQHVVEAAAEHKLTR